MKIFWDVPQGSLAWQKLRLGIPTASEFDKIITPKTMKPSAQRKSYQCRLIAEKIMNWQAKSLDAIDAIAEGKANEPIAAAHLELTKEIKTRAVGFVMLDDGTAGASPDRLVMLDDNINKQIELVVELKSPTIPKQFEYLLLEPEDAYRCQVQAQLWVCDADKALLFCHNPRMPSYELETGRDDLFMTALADVMARFTDELHEMTERANSLGLYQAYADLVSPVDAELGDNIRRGGPPSAEELASIIEGPIGDRLAWGG